MQLHNVSGGLSSTQGGASSSYVSPNTVDIEDAVLLLDTDSGLHMFFTESSNGEVGGEIIDATRVWMEFIQDCSNSTVDPRRLLHALCR